VRKPEAGSPWFIGYNPQPLLCFIRCLPASFAGFGGAMPIYEYRCSSCGFQKEYLRKVSDPVLNTCPECKKSTFAKMLTAAGFQLKGNGWYATDFKGGSTSGAKSAETKSAETKSESKAEAAAPVCGAGACSACS
jgi:putative FmdB family regulatory protein